jgi:signal transduction histidine kinase
MKPPAALWRPAQRLIWRMLSFPIYFKIMGIGVLIALLFGGATLYQIRWTVEQSLYLVLDQQALSTALSTSSRVALRAGPGDSLGLAGELHKVMAENPDMAYAAVQDDLGRILAGVFAPGWPGGLPPRPQFPPGDTRNTRLVFYSGKTACESTVSLWSGNPARLRLAISDALIQEKLFTIVKRLFWSLLVCAAAGQGLALVLTYLITRPVKHLIRATEQVGQGNYSVETPLFSGDEIGKLAVSFNTMARELEKYRLAVQEKETARQHLLKKIITAQEEERKRIARELHDELGQSLLALLLAVQSFPAQGSGSQPDFLQDTEARVRGMINEVRRLSQDLRPSLLDDYGLNTALSRYVAEVSDQFGVSLDYQCSAPETGGRLSNSMEAGLFRIVQEAVTNIVRHSQARRSSVVLIQQRQQVTLLIEDDGDGFQFPAARPPERGGLGIMGMQERAQLLGGEFTITSTKGKGTSIRVRIPLEKAGACQSG